MTYGPDNMPKPHIKPRRTHLSNYVFKLPGGTEDNDLWVWVDTRTEGGVQSTVLRSCWVPSVAQREAIAEGCNIELCIWGEAHPPVSVNVCSYPLGKAPSNDG